MNDEKINSLDVFKYYDKKIKDLVSKNTNQYINDLFSKTNYDKKLTNELIAKIQKQQIQIDTYNKKFFNKPLFFKRLKGIMPPIFFILFIVSVILVVYSYIFSDGWTNNTRLTMRYVGFGLLSVFAISFAIFLILFFKWRKQSWISKEVIDPIIKQNDQDTIKMINEMLNITSSIKARDCFDIYEKSFANFKINNHISNVDFNLWNEVLSLDDNESLYCEMHGNVYNHPYMYLTLKSFEMKDVPYTGSITVMIPRMNSKGTFSTEAVTVAATIMKPKPFFDNDSHFVYKVGVYPKLSFNSFSSFSNIHHVKSFYKRHKNYSMMENPKFDMLLPCERNDDLQFHTVFSIYTQEQIINCIEQYKLKNLQITKHGMYVYIDLDNGLTNKRLVYSGDVFLNYSPQIIKDSFVNAMNNNMKYLYQYMSPIFSISMFQQERFKVPTSNSKNNKASACMVEKIINSNSSIERYFNKNTSNIVYDGIPKTSILYQTSKYSVSKLTLFSFSHTPKVQYVTRFAGNKVVSVPIHYNEYNKIDAKYLALSWINNTNMKDFVIENKNEYMVANKIHGIYKYVDQVAVIFDSSIKSIKGKENTIINCVNKILV